MLLGEPKSAICVQRFDDSLNSAIHTTYRSWLRSSSMREPRDPPSKVVKLFFFSIDPFYRYLCAQFFETNRLSNVCGAGADRAAAHRVHALDRHGERKKTHTTRNVGRHRRGARSVLRHTARSRYDPTEQSPSISTTKVS